MSVVCGLYGILRFERLVRTRVLLLLIISLIHFSVSEFGLLRKKFRLLGRCFDLDWNLNAPFCWQTVQVST